MGREIRRVKAGWEHPRDGSGEYIPLLEGFAENHAKWIQECEQFDNGLAWDYARDCWRPITREEYDEGKAEVIGEEPVASRYTPDWSEEEKTHFQLYETVSEGTPLSPPMPSLEALAAWLVDGYEYYSSDDHRLSYEEWLRMCKAGWAPSGLVVNGQYTAGFVAIGRGLVSS